MDTMGQGRGPENETDGAEQAFEALREEVAALRRGIELLYRHGQQVAPDYSQTLGKMEKALQAIAGRLDTVERQPALRMTPAGYRTELDTLAERAASIVSRPFVETLQQTKAITGDLKALAGRVREQKEQRRWLATAGAIGAIGGVLLWLMLIALLPWGVGDRLAAFPLGSNPWQAGLALMRRDSPKAFDKMVRLFNACPPDSTTELCEAAMAVRTIPPPEVLPSAGIPPTSASRTLAGSPQPAPEVARQVRPQNRAAGH